MKRYISCFLAAISIGTLGFLAVTPQAHAQGQGSNQVRGDTGLVRLGPGQMLRVFVSAGVRAAEVRFRRLEYSESVGVLGVKKFGVSDNAQTGLVDLQAGEGASFDVPDSGTVCRVITTGTPVKVRAAVIDSTTGEILSFIGGADDGQSI